MNMQKNMTNKFTHTELATLLTMALVVTIGYVVFTKEQSVPVERTAFTNAPTQDVPSLSPMPASTPTATFPSTPTVTPTPSVSLLRVCPEEWYDNRMSTIVGPNDVPREYFIYKGVRRELSEFDVNWVKTNCSVKPQIVE